MLRPGCHGDAATEHSFCSGFPRRAGIPVLRPGLLPLLFVLVLTLPAIPACGSRKERLALTPQQWRGDLHFLARELPRRHASAFHYTSRQRFEVAVADLDRSIERLDGDGVWVGLLRITCLVGDAHTYLQVPRDDAEFPLGIRWFADGYRVVVVAPGLERALGARVIEVQGGSVEGVRHLILPLTTQDENPPLAQTFVTGALTTGATLHGLGILPARDAVRYTLADEGGREFSLDARAFAPGESERTRWIWPFEQPPLYRQRPEQGFWFTDVPGTRTVYCSFRSYRDLRKNVRALLRMVDAQRPDKLVIDLRQNDGGDYTQGLKHLIRPLRNRPLVNRRGHLFVLIGPRTFSAAMANAAQFHAETAAILVGKTIGEKPNSYQEPRSMTLPNSHLTVRFSTRYYAFAPGGKNVVRPDQEIDTTWEEFKAGRDPVLDWVLAYPTGVANPAMPH
jgi:hypothetical protein